jgi:hypothetical protein
MSEQTRCTELLVSVRSSAEAEAALAGGAHLIDVKEPERGPLGRAESAVIGEVLATVAGRRPVSAALGELREFREVSIFVNRGLSYVKCGLSGLGADGSWRGWLASIIGRLACDKPACELVTVAYADAERAAAPPPAAVYAFALNRPGSVLLVDTFDKSTDRLTGRPATLLDWLSLGDVVKLCGRCRDAGVRVALAGSLRLQEIKLLRKARPDWFAVRGAACAAGQRGREVCAERVRELVNALG